jgi:hypothetical protein
MTSLNELKAELTGDTGSGMSDAVLSTIAAVTTWPVDAFAADLGTPSDHTVVWVQGGAIGILSATRSFENPDIKVVVRPARAVRSVALEPRIVDNGIRSVTLQKMTVDFDDGQPLTIDESKYWGEHFRRHVREFIAAVLKAL